jgi:nitrate reductase NapAB chaperone NapD
MKAIITYKELITQLKKQIPGIEVMGFSADGLEVIVDETRLQKREVVMGQSIICDEEGKFVVNVKKQRNEIIFQ